MKTDLTAESPIRGMLLFALPIFIGNIIHQGYQVVDMAVVSHALGDTALAALGCTIAVYIVVVGLSSGLSNGFSLVIAQYYGSRDSEGLSRAVTAALYLWAGLSILVMGAGVFGVESLLKLLRTPDQALPLAAAYLKIIFLGIPVIFAYTMLAGLLRGTGNSVMPLVFLFAAALLNIAFDVVFIILCGFGVSGAAMATILSEGVSVLLCLRYMVRHCPELCPAGKFLPSHGISCLVPDAGILFHMLGTGLSMGLMICFVDVGIMILQTAINDLGEQIVAGYAAARRFHSVFMLGLVTLGVAASTFASQNIGAGQWKRARQGVRYAVFLALLWVAAVNAAVYFGAEGMISLITGSGNSEIIRTGAMYLRIDAPFYAGIAVLIVLRSSLQGMGGRLFSLGEGVLELSGNIVFALYVVPSMGYLGVCLCEPVTCSLCAAYIFLCYVAVLRRQKSGLMKKEEKRA